uniref:Uncharacterized protein n=1 Tax=Arundo donax TaxID=35708 RepID=A0A0A9FX88_ARUDO
MPGPRGRYTNSLLVYHYSLATGKPEWKGVKHIYLTKTTE